MTVLPKKKQMASLWPCAPVVAAVLSNACGPGPAIATGVPQSSPGGGTNGVTSNVPVPPKAFGKVPIWSV
jgi:hypothetical protein